LETVKNVPKDIDTYIRQWPESVQRILSGLREVIREAAPDAVEAISYGMPTFRLNGNLVHFAAYKKHIGFYPTPSGITAFKEELSDYPCTKGAIRFSLDKPLPFKLIGRIVRFRVMENIEKKKSP
jgi:uncharacterized protein YdhG (YjbR/CyaY superfamily)